MTNWRTCQIDYHFLESVDWTGDFYRQKQKKNKHIWSLFLHSWRLQSSFCCTVRDSPLKAEHNYLWIDWKKKRDLKSCLLLFLVFFVSCFVLCLSSSLCPCLLSVYLSAFCRYFASRSYAVASVSFSSVPISPALCVPHLAPDSSGIFMFCHRLGGYNPTGCRLCTFTHLLSTLSLLHYLSHGTSLELWCAIVSSSHHNEIQGGLAIFAIIYIRPYARSEGDFIKKKRLHRFLCFWLALPQLVTICVRICSTTTTLLLYLSLSVPAFKIFIISPWGVSGFLVFIFFAGSSKPPTTTTTTTDDYYWSVLMCFWMFQYACCFWTGLEREEGRRPVFMYPTNSPLLRVDICGNVIIHLGGHIYIDTLWFGLLDLMGCRTVIAPITLSICIQDNQDFIHCHRSSSWTSTALLITCVSHPPTSRTTSLYGQFALPPHTTSYFKYFR